MADARITLTIHTSTNLHPEHLGPLAAAAAEGFKVDGWEVVETEAEAVDPDGSGIALNAVGNFQEGDPVLIRDFVPGTTSDLEHYVTGEAVVQRVDFGDGSLFVQYTGPEAGHAQWVHHTFAELR